jgi:phage baseplate assembly protein V
VSGDDAVRALVAPAGPHDRVYGVVVGIVTNNQDPEGMHRIKVRFPWLSKDVESNWARVAAPMTGKDRGTYFLPEVDDEVLVAFEHGQIDHPFVVGSVWNGRDGAPESNADGQNNHRTIKSRSGHVLRFNDTAGGETIEIIDKTGGNKIVIDSASNTITIEAKSDIAITSAMGKLTMQANGVEIRSRMGVSVEATQNIDVKANAIVTVKGAMIRLN